MGNSESDRLTQNKTESLGEENRAQEGRGDGGERRGHHADGAKSYAAGDFFTFPPCDDGILAGRSRAMQDLRQSVRSLRDAGSAMLLTGETGTGKRALARFIHAESARRDHPFVSVNVAALGRDYSAQLFSSVALPGRLAAVGEGTLALFDIADLGDLSQGVLEELMESGAYRLMNGRRLEKLRARIISITCADLGVMVERGRFRASLVPHIGMISLRMPPLRERIEDIPEILGFLRQEIVARGLPRCRMLKETVATLQEYPWPGNLRELDAVVHTLSVLSQDGIIDRELVQYVLSEQEGGAAAALTSRDLQRSAAQRRGGGGSGNLGEGKGGAENEGVSVHRSGPAGKGRGETLSESVARHLESYFSAHGEDLPPTGVYDRILAEVERPLLRKCLEVCGGSQVKAAELLGMNRNTLRKKMKELSVTASRSV